MSRIGKLPIHLDSKIEAKLIDEFIEIKGPLGTLKEQINELIDVKVEDGIITVTPKNPEDNFSIALWGTTRANINNMVEGVTNGYKKSLEINGVGYKMEVSGTKLILSIGFSHKVEIEAPSDITLNADEKKKNVVHFSGINKQKLGEFVAKIRAMKKPEPYKGKGIKYVGENIKRKVGKKK